MRRGSEALVLAVSLLLLAAGGAMAQDPEAVQEDVAAAIADLEAAGQPPTEAEVADLLAEHSQARNPRSGAGEFLVRWQRTGAGLAGREAALWSGGSAWDLRLRARQAPAGPQLLAGSGAAATGPLAIRVGGWTWREGYGLLLGGAGRTGSVAADAGLGPGSHGARGWTGWPDRRAARGAALRLAHGGWEVGGAWGRVEAEPAVLAVVALGRQSGSWRIAAVRWGDEPPAAGASGHWRRGPWSGDWDLSVRAGALPAAANHLRWSGGRRWGAEILTLVLPQGATGPTAASAPLVGTGTGTGGALRVSWRPEPGAALSALVAGARRDGQAAAEPQRRVTSDVLGRAPLPADLSLSARLRTTAGRQTAWSPEWPWAPPQTEASRRTQVLSLALESPDGRPWWRLVVRSLAVDHSPTSGRRTLVAAELRSGYGRRLHWRLAWRLAWGDPVDLADAVSPLPGLVVPRHWGAWSGGWFGRLGWTGGPWRLDAAVDLRTATAGGREVECWLGGGARW